jgi:hypothetical protein
MALTLNPSVDLRNPTKQFIARGRAQVADLLDGASAELLSSWLEDPAARWNLVAFVGGKHRDLDKAGMNALSDIEKQRFEGHLHASARDGFSYLFDNIPIYDIRRSGTQPDMALLEAVDFLNSAPVLDLARAVTGNSEIAFADAQATCYRNGAFLTSHNDGVEGKNRVAAYVLSMTRRWSADWGGLLLFEDEDGNIEQGFTPAYNTLNLFSVPQPHFVSQVAPFAGAPRLSITGWFRVGKDPGPSPQWQ